jgi:hypothetical protein
MRTNPPPPGRASPGTATKEVFAKNTRSVDEGVARTWNGKESLGVSWRN